MNAKFSNIVNQNRHELQEVLPLETPYSMFVDVCNACNFKCKFCAIQYADRKLPFKKMCMEYDLFKKVINDIKAFPSPLKMLRLAANGEPLMNKRLPEMIKYAKDAGVADHIEIVTNASLLSPELNRKLVEAGLDRIRISIEEIDAEGYYRMSGVKIDWEKFVDNIRNFYENRGQCEVYIKTVDAAVESDEKKEKFLSTFGNICDSINIEHVIPIWAGYSEINDDFSIENVEGLHGHAIQGVDVCPFPFYSCVINPDGEITICCNDWERKKSMGNVKTESIYDVWNGPKYYYFLTEMLKNGRKKSCPEVCAKCEYPCYDAVDHLDPYREEVLKKFIDRN